MYCIFFDIDSTVVSVHTDRHVQAADYPGAISFDLLSESALNLFELVTMELTLPPESISTLSVHRHHKPFFLLLRIICRSL
jgi:hypothetical protein